MSADRKRGSSWDGEGAGGRPRGDRLKGLEKSDADQFLAWPSSKPCCTPLGRASTAQNRVRPVEGARAHAQSGGHCHVRRSRGLWLQPANSGVRERRGRGGWSGGNQRRQWKRAGTRDRRHPSGMEVLDEFDGEFPQSVTFCQLISEEDFEWQAATYTEHALRRLFHSLDSNPALAERVVRRGKQAERERRGLLSFLWAKFVCAVQGELNCCNSVGALEMQQRLEQLKERIHRVHLYSQGAKKKRRKPEPILLRDRPTSACLPSALPAPPSLPPTATTTAALAAPAAPVYTMPRVFGPFPVLPSESVENIEVSRSTVKLNWTSLSSNPKSHMVDLTPVVLNPGGVHFSYLAGNSPDKLHGPDFPWTSACSDSHSTEETPSPPLKASVFNPPVLLKFQPVPRPKDDSENDAGSIEPKPHKRDP
ncbi:uncharacterized protein [Manis javanica]|uniref:uncharacterized protein isoform X1 n=1 Tax=Manis javanica TaxID=9974 RepID=UPI003C6CE64A